ncbi:MAG: Ig-like domain-containing protein, partial [Actinomycetota bacterium]|nr:Ig-like domain-containing protein [Actinomycetota bacterium]
PPPAPGPFVPPAACGNLSLSREIVVVGHRTTVRARVVDQNGAAMARVRVRARGSGVRKMVRTASNGVARLRFRPRRAGTIVVRAGRGRGCVARITVVGRFRPPQLTG